MAAPLDRPTTSLCIHCVSRRGDSEVAFPAPDIDGTGRSATALSADCCERMVLGTAPRMERAWPSEPYARHWPGPIAALHPMVDLPRKERRHPVACCHSSCKPPHTSGLSQPDMPLHTSGPSRTLAVPLLSGRTTFG